MLDPFSAFVSMRSRHVQGNKLRGVVVNNNDPEKRGRVKVRYRDIHDNISDEDLPWSSPKEGFGSGSKGVGHVKVPPVGTTVFGSHQDNSLYHPEYTEGPATDDKKVDELTGDDYPHNRGHVDHKGNYTFHQGKDDDNTVGFTHQSGSGQVTDKDGNVTHMGAGKYKINGAKEIELIGKSPVKIHSQEAIDIRAPKVTVNAGSPDKPSDVKARDKPQLPNTGGMTEY